MDDINCLNCMIDDFKHSLCDNCNGMRRRGTAEELERLIVGRPEIIHCRECKYGVDYYNEGDCYCSNPKWGLKYFGGSWEFYCADAEMENSGKETAQEE